MASPNSSHELGSPQMGLPFTIYPKKIRSIRLLLLSFLVGSCGAFMVQHGNAWGWLGVLFFWVLGIPVLLLRFLPRSAFLRVSEDGIEFASIFKRTAVNWNDIEQFGTYGTAGGRFVGFSYTPSYHASHKTGKFSRALVGFENGLPDTYGYAAEELAALLSAYYRERRGH